MSLLNLSKQPWLPLKPIFLLAKTVPLDLCHKVQIKLHQMQDQWWEAKVVELQGYADRHHMRQFYAGLKAVYRPTHDMMVPVKSRDGGALITDREETRQQWVQHFEELLNTESSIAEEALNCILQEANIDVMDAPPTVRKTEAAMRSMKKGDQMAFLERFTRLAVELLLSIRRSCSA
nr:PREDICTED: uncharacterized protein LOC106705380 [Latimeria chalumnae]|eukprot:XP_014350153.1 PREDICTED: uncharacterized protein LOC106705380 [Latimeria chalumnae]